jgi:hypothetical protein
VVKAEMSQDGYAKTLRHMIDNKLINDETIQDLNIFLEKILGASIIISDLNPRNIVYSYNKENKTNRFVLIDGTGDKTFIPMQNIFPILRKSRKMQYTKYLKKIISDYTQAS